jgi:hypothetical protein
MNADGPAAGTVGYGKFRWSVVSSWTGAACRGSAFVTLRRLSHTFALLMVKDLSYDDEGASANRCHLRVELQTSRILQQKPGLHPVVLCRTPLPGCARPLGSLLPTRLLRARIEFRREAAIHELS